MGEKSKIAWTDNTFNVAWGCEKVSPACAHCYAEAWAKRTGFDVWGKNGARRTFDEKHWREPWKWNLQAEREGAPIKVFCSSMCDVFEDHPILAQERLKLWPLIERTPYLRWQLLTKRIDKVMEMLPPAWTTHGRIPDNVWIGTTVDNQEWADKRLPHLISIPAKVRFVSYEPALGPVDFTQWPSINWIIVGGESGPNSSRFLYEWAQDTITQAKQIGAACFVKQMGANPWQEVDDIAMPWKLQDKKGGDWNEWPEELRVREFPV